MIDASFIRYSSHGKFSTLNGALKKLAKLQEQHPDREYTIIVNRRARRAYNVAQVRPIKVQIPEPGKDFHDPGPPTPPGVRRFYWNTNTKLHVQDPAWAQYERDLDDYKAYLCRKTGSIETILTEPMNP